MILDPARWQAASTYLDEVLELEEPSRDAWIAALGEREPAVATDVRLLLEQHRALERERFLEGSAPHPASPAFAGQTVGAYTVLDPIGQGGMGSVWRAERSDGRFHRLAAIKFLNVGLMGRPGQERFTREGRILAKLTHPHIAQLIDAGMSNWGQPYLILEYVDGVPIDRYCERENTDLAGRIRLFLDVASAVAQAHAHLIVHRDLKPSNVLVTASGDVKLLDFGIARLLDDQSPLTPATLTGGGAMTPAFAAPEQITGAPITTATDVYALGSLLYLLLTGTHATGETTQSTAELVRAIIDAQPKPMSSFPGLTIPADVETIVMTALKKDPAERYGSVPAMAADLDRFLRHEPIAARPDTLGYRTAKFLRRQRVPVTLAVLAAAALSFGFYEINRQRALAEQRFLEVRQLANRLFDIDIPLRGIPGSAKVRQMLVDTSLEYLRRLGSEVGDDPDLALEIGTAYMRVARVQGIPISINLGQVDEAEKNLQTAERIVAGVIESRPSNRLAFLRMGQIKHDRMILAGNRRPDDAALPLAKESAAWLGKYLDSGAADHVEAPQVLLAMNNVSNRFRIARQFDEALRWSYRAIEIAQSLNQPLQVSSLLQGTAFIHRDRGDLDAALKDIRESVRLLQAPTTPNDASQHLSLSLALAREGIILGAPNGVSLNRPTEAIAPLERSYAIADEIAHQDKDDALSNGRLWTSAGILAAILRNSDPVRALSYYDHVLTHVSQIKNNPQMRRYEARAQAQAVYPLLRLGKIDSARERLKIAFALLADLKLYPRNEVALGTEADNAVRASAELEARSGNFERAIEIDNGLLAKIMASEPEQEEALADAMELSTLWGSIAEFSAAAHLPENASALHLRQVQLWQHWDRKLPGNAFVRRQLDAATGASRNGPPERR
ncbi:MAG TPA: protein kinase [Vicinamibacterales bacterium]|nr:protein kinase [Vicinamibacterales bacterium]